VEYHVGQDPVAVDCLVEGTVDPIVEFVDDPRSWLARESVRP
jgi:hypothetical protein